jgi:hypothetical protein
MLGSQPTETPPPGNQFGPGGELDLPGAPAIALRREAPLSRTQVFALVVLAAIALYVVATVATRMHDGRCAVGGGVRRALDCSYPVLR